MSREKIVASKGGDMNQSNGTRHGKAGIVLFFLLACAAFALWAPNAEAVPDYLTGPGSFTNTYPSTTSTKLNSCILCHQTASGSP
jgi:hypothetical protein